MCVRFDYTSVLRCVRLYICIEVCVLECMRSICFRMYAFDLFLRRVWIVLRCVFYVRVGIYIHIACMFGKCIMGYEYFIYSIDMCGDVSI
jgi:hypothetical protein